jgi:hypothetical protein
VTCGVLWLQELPAGCGNLLQVGFETELFWRLQNNEQLRESWNTWPHCWRGRWPWKVVMERDRVGCGFTEKFKHLRTCAVKGLVRSVAPPPWLK